MDSILEWTRQHETLFFALGVVSIVTFVGGLLVVPVLIVRIPEDYFVRPPGDSSRFAHRHPAIAITAKIVKNVIGVLLALAGIAMLVLPGQGLLTLLVGLLLIDGPGKRRVELWILKRRPIHATIDWIRRRRGHPPLQLPDGIRDAD